MKQERTYSRLTYSNFYIAGQFWQFSLIFGNWNLWLWAKIYALVQGLYAPCSQWEISRKEQDRLRKKKWEWEQMRENIHTCKQKTYPSPLNYKTISIFVGFSWNESLNITFPLIPQKERQEPLIPKLAFGSQSLNSFGVQDSPSVFPILAQVF